MCGERGNGGEAERDIEKQGKEDIEGRKERVRKRVREKQTDTDTDRREGGEFL